jgi:CheY-like chemotaxis protein
MSGELNSSSVTRPLRVLFVDDCDDDVQLSIRVLEKAGYAIHPDVVQTQEQLGRALRSGDYDLILCDYRLPGWSGGDVLRMVRDSGRELPVVLVTGTLGEETAVEMIKLERRISCSNRGSRACRWPSSAPCARSRSAKSAAVLSRPCAAPKLTTGTCLKAPTMPF